MGAGWLIRVLIATAVMGGVAWLVAPRVTAATVPELGPRLTQLLFLAYSLAVAGGAYLVAAYILRLPELAQAWNRLPARLTNLPGLRWLGGRMRPESARTWRRR